MMKNSIFIRVVISTFVLTTLLSCNNWLDVKPTDRQTEAQIFGTKGGFYSALNGAYGLLNSTNLYGQHLSFNMTDVMAQLFTIASINNKPSAAFQKYSFSETVMSDVIRSVWKESYKVILNCNVILENTETRREVLSDKDYNLIKGEVLALRAFIHFDMLRLFGPVYATGASEPSIPYVTSRAGDISDILTAEQVAQLVLSDIAAAETLLKDVDPVIEEGRALGVNLDGDYVIGDSTLYKYRQLRFNYYAVQALKARVQLYIGNKTAALATAKSLIESEKINTFFPKVESSAIIGNNTNPDRIFSTEILFGFYNKNIELINKNFFNPEDAKDYLLQPRTNYIEQVIFGDIPADYRVLGQWLVSSSATNTSKTLAKFKPIDKKTLFQATIVPLIRISELYLIAAECEPNFNDGQVHLNYLRVNMRGNIGLPLKVTSEATFKTEIMKEYIREFYGEGQMFYYYKRNNTESISIYNGNSTTTVKPKYVLPLPSEEIIPR